ncbi:MAG: subtilisin family serine protease [Cognaticolwellia sp.]|jgi:subtilisin family serine protease
MVIGVVDGGVDITHPELREAVAENRIQVHRVCKGDAPIPDHGTAVASLLVGREQGLAPAARLVVADVYGRGRHARAVKVDPADVYEGLRWMIEDCQVDVILMTLERRGQDPWLRDLAKRAHEKGILLIASIGNGGLRGETGSPGNYPEVLGVGSLTIAGRAGPESASGVLTWDGLQVPKPELMAPGSGVRVALCPGRYGWERGTSFAAPLVASAAALLLQERPWLSPDELRASLGSGNLTLEGSLRYLRDRPRMGAEPQPHLQRKPVRPILLK